MTEISGISFIPVPKLALAGVEFVIERGNLVFYVVDEDSVAIEGATINISSTGHDETYTTDADGFASGVAVPDIVNTIVASATGYATETLVVTPTGNTSQQFLIQLKPSELRLLVVNRVNGPIESALCEVLDGIVSEASTKDVIYIDTVDDYLRYASGIPIAASANVKMGLWLKPTAWSAGNGGIWRGGDTSIGTSFMIFNAATGRPWVRWNGTDILKPTSGYQLPLDAWAYIEYEIISGSTVTFSVDGEVKHTANHTKATAAFSIHNFGYQGTIGERVAGYYKELTIEENETLKMRWKGDEGTGSTLNDFTGNEYNGTIFGATWSVDETFPIPASSGGLQGYEATPYDSASTNANGLVTLDYKIETLHGLRVTINGKRNFIMPFQRDNYGLLDWQVKLDHLLASFLTDGGKVLINGQPYNNDNNFLIG